MPAVLVVGLALAGCASDGSSTGAGDAGAPPGSASAGREPEGFSTVRARVTSGAGEVCEVCLWLADTTDERARGLKEVTDLGEADGMLFVWDEPAISNFVMIDTPTPLSIAWFGDDGAFVSAADMDPCTDADESACERYPAGNPYSAAIEVVQGGLDEMGVGPGSTLEILADTESATCVAAG